MKRETSRKITKIVNVATALILVGGIAASLIVGLLSLK